MCMGQGMGCGGDYSVYGSGHGLWGIIVYGAGHVYGCT